MASIEDDEVDPQTQQDFMLKCMSKCANYRNETKKEKQKQLDLNHEITREFGSTPEVNEAVARIKSKIEKDLISNQKTID